MAGPWPKPQQEQLDRLLESLSEAEEAAQSHHPYTPAQDRYHTLVHSLWRIVAQADVDGQPVVDRLRDYLAQQPHQDRPDAQAGIDMIESIRAKSLAEPEPPAHEVKGWNLSFTME